MNNSYTVTINLMVTTIDLSCSEYYTVSKHEKKLEIPSKELEIDGIDTAIVELTQQITEIDPAWTIPKLVEVSHEGGSIDVFYKITIPYDTELLPGNYWLSQSKTQNDQNVLAAIYKT